MYLGCALENSKYHIDGKRLFDPDKVANCQNALGHDKAIIIKNMLPELPNGVGEEV